MKLLIRLFVSLIFIGITHLQAQVNQQSLKGTWYVVDQADHSPIKLDEDILLEEPPRTLSEPSKPKREPFVERWTFDGSYAYIQPARSLTHATTYELDKEQLQLNMSTPQSYEVVYLLADSLVLAKDREESFGSTYTDTLYMKRKAIEVPGLEEIKNYVQQESLHTFQLHGVYQWVIERDKFEDLSKVLNENEVVTLSLRFYPDNTVVFMMSVIDKDAIGVDRCRECSKLDGNFYPYPFGLHELKKKGGAFYFQPEYTWMGDVNRSDRVKIDKSDQIRFGITLNEGAIRLKTDSEFDLLSDAEQLFTFIPFHKINYHFEK